jgi:hypothetical protein
MQGYRLFGFAMAATVGMACGGATTSGSGGGGSGAKVTNGYSAVHPAPPQLIDQGGPVLTAPKVVTITFPGDANAAALEAFGAQLTNNAWWDTVRGGYCETASSTCVGTGPAGTHVEITTAPGPSYTDSIQGGPSTLQAYIQGLVTGGQVPQPDGQTILAFYLPATTTITLDGAASCDVFGAYHNATAAGGAQFTYAVVSECPVLPQGPPMTLLQQTTFAASHEIFELATDPFQTPTTLGFYLNMQDPAILPWNNVGGGEAADLCSDFLGLGQDQTIEAGFLVTRVWSNAAAAAGGDPCLPSSSAVYINAAPEKWLLTIPVGGSTTFQATAFSSSATANWTLVGGDLNTSATDTSPYLTVTINGAKSASVNNGDKVTVSVTLKQDPANLPDYAQALGATGILISADSTKNPTNAHFWPFLVVTPAGAANAKLDNVDPSEDQPRRAHASLTRAQLARFADGDGDPRR